MPPPHPDAARQRALELAPGRSVREVAEQLTAEGHRVGKTAVAGWLRLAREAGTLAPAAPKREEDEEPEEPARQADGPPAGQGADSASGRPSDATRACSFEERVLYLADLIATGRWAGRPTARRLAATWQVDRATVFAYARSAAVVAKTDRGSVEHAREDSLGQWKKIRDTALQRKDVRGAAAAQAGWDRAAGVVAPGGPTVNVLTVAASPAGQALLRTVLAALANHPEALADVKAAVREASRPVPKLGCA